MLKAELKSLWQNKLLILVMAAIVLIPSIYAGLFLSSMWDPYGDLSALPVAVVNQDEPVIYNDKELAIGNSLAENLEENDAMAFNIVSEDVAFKGLKNGTYYMVITIPQDFSQNATTLMDDEPQQMKLEYTTNPGKNYISMKLGESAMKTIQANINEEVTKTYAENVFDAIGDVEVGFNDATDGTEEMLDGEEKLSDGNKEITDNLLTLANGSKLLKDGTVSLSKGANTLNGSMGQLTSGAGELAGGVGEYTDGVGQLATGIGTLKAGTDKLSGSVPALKKGVGDLKSGADQLAAGYEGENGAVKGASNLAAGISQVNDAVQAISLPSVTLTDEQKAGIQAQATASVESQADAIKTQAANGIAAKEADIKALAKGSVEATIAQTSQEQKMQLVAQGATKTEVQGAASQVAGSIGAAAGAQAAAQVKSALAEYGVDLTDEQAAAMANGIGNAIAANPQVIAGIAQVGGAGYAVGYGDGAIDNAGTIAYQTAQSVAGDVAVQAAKSAAGTAAVAGAQGVATQVNQSLGEFSTQLATLQGATAQLTEGSAKLSTGVKKLYNGTKQVDEGLTTLNNSSGQLADGANQLSDGAKQLQDGAKKLTDNSGKLKSGAVSLSDGTVKVADAVSQIANGSNELKSGAEKVEDGAYKLHDGSRQLGDGLGELKDGTVTLHDALADGAKEVGENKAGEATIEMFAAPVTTEEHLMTTVDNNGHGMAAYMMSVGLWVGCLAFCLMYPLTEYHGDFRSGLRWWFSKAAIAAPAGAIMVAVLMATMSAFLGFEPGSVLNTFIVALSAVTAFMCIQYFFDVLLGRVGSFLMLIFMVLQLTGSAGTYPIEISGNLASALHNWMPFTYSVNGFRAAIAAGDTASIMPEVTVLIVIAVVFTVLTVLLFEFRGRCIQNGKTMLYDWIEEKGLA